MAQEIDLSAFKSKPSEPEVREVPRMISARISKWVDDALDQVAFGEEVSFDIGAVLHPEQGMVHILGMFIKGAELGTLTGTQLALPGQTLTEEAVLRIVTEMFEQLRAERSKALSQTPQ